MKRKNEKKCMGSKLFSGIMAALMMVTIMSVAGLTSGAANTTDAYWGFNISASSATYHLVSPRQKQDSSPMYVYWASTSGPTKMYIQTYGGKGQSISDMHVCNTSYGWKIMRGTGRYSVSSLVFETYGLNSYGSFGLRGYEGSGTVSGQWSVDSSGRYNPLP